MKKYILFIFVASFSIILFTGWGAIGHSIINRTTTNSFPPQMISFRAWSDSLVKHASDADTRKGSANPTEAPKHYIDIDYYPEFNTDHRIPQTLDSMNAKYGASVVTAQGILPFAILATADSLRQAFARRDFSKAMLLAADLGHYVADGHMPLHITQNYDGGMTNQSGIHSRYETKLVQTYQSQIVFNSDTAQYISNINDYVFSFIYEDYTYADSVLYADSISKALTGSTSSTAYYTSMWNTTGNLMVKLMKNASFRLASLIYTAWTDAGKPDMNSGIKNIDVAAGWNILSAPMNSTNPLISSVFTGANSLAYGYNTGYFTFDTMVVGRGFWLRNAAAATITMTGIPATGNTIPLMAGWNLIGGQMTDITVANITTTPAGIINSFFYGFANGYTTPATLVSGTGYWVQTSAAGTMNTAALAKNSTASLPAIEQDWAKITITDRTGKSSTLYITNKNVQLNSFELPPLPPAGVFDARFSTQRCVEVLGTEPKLISLSSVEYPVDIRAEGIELRVSDKATNGKIVNSVLKSGTSVSISNPGVNSIEIASIEKPVSYELSQNYPNPFNPATTIKFALPENANVSLTVYNQIGEKVADLVNGQMESGYHSILWNAENFASGVYFYQIKAGNFSSVRKLLLLK